MTDRELKDRGERASARKAPTNMVVGKCRLGRHSCFEVFAFPAGSEILPWARSVAPGSGTYPDTTRKELDAKHRTPRVRLAVIRIFSRGNLRAIDGAGGRRER